MFVLCPHCQFLVAVDPATGQPPAHCPRCGGAVAPSATEPAPAPATPPTWATTDASAGVASDDGDGEVVDDRDPPAATLGPILQEPRSEPAPETVERDADPAAGSPPEVAAAPVDEPPAAAADASPRATHKQAPSFVRTPIADGSRGRRRGWRTPIAIAGLAVLLALQMLLADRAQLAADAHWRPVVELLCAALRCDLPPWHEPAAFTLLDRDVRPDPRTPGVLHVRARFRNDARWPQAWPRVQLTLSDVDGRVAGARLFVPRDYAAQAVTQNPIASGQVADIVMDIVEPAPGIVAFTFDFR